MTTTASPGTQAIDRAADLLLRLLEADESHTLGELVDESGLPKSTASRLLRALERNGLAQRDARGRFRPGPALVRYAQRGAGALDLAGVAQQHLQHLAEETGETINLAVPSARGVEIIAQVDSRYLLGGTNWIGMQVPAHASALGKVFLALGAAPPPTGRLEQIAPRTITDVVALLEELGEVRERGYAVTDEELEPGLIAIAAPVLGPGGGVIAALSISGPTFRIAPADIAALGALVSDEAARLSARLGYRHHREGAE